jgi:hypothetical protein
VQGFRSPQAALAKINNQTFRAEGTSGTQSARPRKHTFSAPLLANPSTADFGGLGGASRPAKAIPNRHVLHVDAIPSETGHVNNTRFCCSGDGGPGMFRCTN